MSQTLRQMFRFGIVGIAATLVHVAAMVFYVEALGITPVFANLLAFLTALPVSYLGNFHWTFSVRGEHSRRLPRFVFTQSIGFGSSQSIVFVFVELLTIDYKAALAVVVATVPALTYLASRLWVFRGPIGGGPGDPVHE